MFRKPSLLCLAVVITFIGLTTIHGRAENVCGDVNNDAEVNVSDAVWTANYIFIGGPEPVPFLSGEVNCDGSVNVSDAVWIANYVFTGGNDPCDSDGDGIPDCHPDCPPTVTDIDGNVYQTVLIGDQCWMMENLKVTHYRNGDPIPEVTDGGSWGMLSTGAYCNYDNNESYVAVYGRLYNWYAAADSRNIAPDGWHVPSDAEWKQLEMYLGMSQADADATGWRGTDEGGKLKEADTTHWQSPNNGATNESGFTALPGGYRSSSGRFYFEHFDAFFWTQTDYDILTVWYRYLN
ncbi:MAG TPA: hypothetical protein ENO07_05815, partial [candidate division Zixibacteria bacterium]|nr:hypothetical protein [candidate division Zixibacteria bacterium]